MSNMKKMMTIAASILLSIFFFCIVLYLMIEVLELQDTKVGIRPFIFASIDFLIILITIGFGKNVAQIVGTAMYAPIAASTVIYSIAMLSFNCLCSDMESTAMFTLINLGLLFVYLCVVIPLVITGAGREVQQEASEPIKIHNIKNYP